VRLEAGVRRIANGAWLSDEHLPAAFVVAGVGVRPRDDVARIAGLDVDDGVVVDAGQRTSHPAIWAAGDVARHGPVRIEHWHAAREAGERAGRSMLGLPVTPAPEPWFFSEVAGVPIDVVGSASAWDEERWLSDGLLAYLDGGTVVQLASIDSAMDATRMREIVAARAPVESVT
jgi:3-phenylpropionate/trans-cinnamate dioxygenase ferredoxin reductase subunit